MGEWCGSGVEWSVWCVLETWNGGDGVASDGVMVGLVAWLIGCEIVCMKCAVLHASSAVPRCRVSLYVLRPGVLCTWFFRLL